MAFGLGLGWVAASALSSCRSTVSLDDAGWCWAWARESFWGRPRSRLHRSSTRKVSPILLVGHFLPRLHWELRAGIAWHRGLQRHCWDQGAGGSSRSNSFRRRRLASLGCTQRAAARDGLLECLVLGRVVLLLGLPDRQGDRGQLARESQPGEVLLHSVLQ